ncbi:MAG: hypothetical protein RR982_03895 [Kiritimatiellia bacterium]
MKRLTSFLFVAFAASVAFAQGQIIKVDVTGISKQSLSMDGATGTGSAGQLYLTVLRNDLLRSGWYNLKPNGQVQVTGNVTGSADAASSLMVAWTGKRFAWTRTATEAAIRRQAHELADAIVGATTGEKGFAQSHFALVRRGGKTRDGQNADDLFVCDYDGHNLRRLTSDGAAIVGPRWAPDGKSVYFTSYKLGFPAVFRADLQGRVVRLANFRGLNTGAVPSPTNANQLAIILSHQGNPELYVMNATTQGLTRLTSTKFAAEASPCWSPDGRRICYVSDVAGSPQLYIVDVATKQSRRLTLQGGENVQPDWGKNGIVFATKRRAPYRIATINPDVGEKSVRLLTPLNDQYESPSWAADGRHVVASRTQGGSSSIWVIDAAEKGDAPYQVFSGSGLWLNPAWSK